ncbi:universal stress protein [Franconibacter sp. IITDAS19]|uniref:universal stress protein n=1 Tax=Franconibacter sp. IITDAS19 TaxID=2930569 RepID=UPI001FF893B9|nr:universal stress protein [Franconibacter sp. IITDAS19]MCK1967884.1 universal stress protein [Franconibacter sp. IITDAS19]
MNKPVIACLEASAAARSVCDYAAWVAATLGAPLALLHMLAEVDRPDVMIGETSLTTQLGEVEAERRRLRMAQGQALLAECAARLKPSGYEKAQQLQKQGSPAEILQELTETRLLVLGDDGARHPVGSPLESLIRLHRGTVLAVPETFTAPSRALFAYDASMECRKHLARLTASPLLYGMECHIVMVNGNATALQDAFEALHKAGIRAQAFMLEGTSVADSLCRHAQAHNIDLIVMGAWGHSQRRRYFIGRHAADMLFRRRLPLMLLR